MATVATAGAHTYMPDDDHDVQIADFVQALDSALATTNVPHALLVGESGKRIELPTAMFEPLRQVAAALSQGLGVSVVPLNAQPTTQEAANFLGVSRPTLVRMLDRGDLPMQRPGRHRYVMLRDLIDYQRRTSTLRREILDDISRTADEAGHYAVLDGPPTAMR